MKSSSLLCALVLVFATTLRAEPPVLLADALEKANAEEGRWAYLEVASKIAADGAPKEVSRVRVDPSRPYREQYTPVLLDEKPPTAKALEQFAERGEKEAEIRHQSLAKETDGGRAPVPMIELGESRGSLDLEHATVTAEDDHFATFRVPVLATEKSSVPFDNVLLEFRVNKAERALHHVRLSVLTPFRASLFARVKALDVSIDYAPVDPNSPPQPSRFEVHAKIKFLFKTMEEHVKVSRSDHRRVKPYDERFAAKPGALKVFGF